MLSLYAVGKWAVAAMAILGWCYWAIPAILREAGNPALTLTARKQILILAAICSVPLLATLLAMVWLVSSSGNEEPPPPTQTAHVDSRLPSVPDTSKPLAVVADSGSATASDDPHQRAQPARSPDRGARKHECLGVAESKIGYLLGKATGRQHNLGCTLQNAMEFPSVGVVDDRAGRALLREHLEAVGQGCWNVAATRKTQLFDVTAWSLPLAFGLGVFANTAYLVRERRGRGQIVLFAAHPVSRLLVGNATPVTQCDAFRAGILIDVVRPC